MKNIEYLYLFTKTKLKIIYMSFKINVLTYQTHTNFIPSPYQVRTTFELITLSTPRYRTKVERRKYGHGTTVNRSKTLPVQDNLLKLISFKRGRIKPIRVLVRIFSQSGKKSFPV